MINADNLYLGLDFYFNILRTNIKLYYPDGYFLGILYEIEDKKVKIIQRGLVCINNKIYKLPEEHELIDIPKMEIKFNEGEILVQ